MVPFRRHAAAVLLALMSTCVFASACQPRRTEVVVIIDSDMQYGPGMPLAGLLVRVRAGGPDGATRDNRALALHPAPAVNGTYSLPTSIGVLPLNGDATRTFWIEVSGCGGSGCDTNNPMPVVTQRAITGFVQGETLALHMFLADRCRGVVCDPTHTCSPDLGTCVTATMPANTLPQYSPDASTDARTDGTDTSDAPDAPPASAIIQLAASGDHTCALRADHSVWCWGSNDSAALGIGTSSIEHSLSAIQVPGLSALQIAAGGDATCAVLLDHTAVCFGSNQEAQLGVGTTQGIFTSPAAVAGLTDVAEVAVGLQHGCARLNNGQVWCWGAGTSGEAGDPTQSHYSPVMIPGLTDAIGLSAGAYFNCALRRDHTAVCWGANGSLQLGAVTAAGPVATPVAVTGLTNVAEVHAGDDNACALLMDGSVLCWGLGGTLGIGTTTDSATPVAPTGLPPVDGLWVGYLFACAHERGGSDRIFCWGYNTEGQLGQGSTTVDPQLPVEATAVGHNVVTMGAGTYYACAARSDGSVICWGDNAQGQLGNGSSTAFAFAPMDVPGSSGLTRIAALKNARVGFGWGATGVLAWGYNFDGANFPGQPSGGTDAARSLPGWGPFLDLVGGSRHACALRTDQMVQCWGYDDVGQLGDGLTTNRLDQWTTVSVSNVIQISSGITHVCTTSSTGAASCWGSNNLGQLGRGTMTTTETPAAVTVLPSGSNVREIGAGDNLTCALLSDRTVWCWGSNGGYRFFAHPNELNPVQILGLPTTIAHLVVGSVHACVIDGGGNVWCWGANEFHQCGPTDPPVGTALMIPGLSNVTRVAAAGDQTCAIDATGSLFCWGHNGHGQCGLGAGSPAIIPMPTRVPGVDAIDVTASQTLTCALRRSGVATCFGVIPGSGIGSMNTYASPMPSAVLGL